MSFNILPKNVIKGKNSDGTEFKAFEYDYSTYTNMQLMGLFSYLMVGGFFCAIASPIILFILLVHFTGRFNILYLTIPILGGYFIYDCANGWLISAFLNIFIGDTGLLFLASMNMACIVVICVMTLFGGFIYNAIVNKTDDMADRYAMLFFGTLCLFIISWIIARGSIDANWLGITHVNVRD